MAEFVKKTQQEINDYRNYFYLNAYPNDLEKAQRMGSKVYRDLRPFSDFIDTSIKNLRSAAKVGAECKPVLDRKILKPLFTLLRIKASDKLSIARPEQSFYSFEWLEEWGDPNLSEMAVLKGRKIIAEKSQILDFYNGTVIFSAESQIETGSDCKYTLFLTEDDDGRPCNIELLSFNEISKYRIESGKARIASVTESRGQLIVQYSGTPGQEVVLFGEIHLPVLNQSAISLKTSNLTMDEDIPVRRVEGAENIVVAECDDKDVRRLWANQCELSYSVLNKEEICLFLHDTRVRYQDKKIQVIDDAIGEDGDEVVISNLKFSVSNISSKLKKRFKENGIYVELLDNEDFADDLNSNTSYFFRETTEFVTDESGNRYKIGNRSEQFSQMEIGLCDKKGKVSERMLSIPTKLFVEPNTRQLQMQKNAISMLCNKPCQALTPLLELMQNKNWSHWGSVPYQSCEISEWYRLTNPDYDGCDSQRDFVKKALTTPDFAILEGPPGSGKTTTILEIIAQMIERGQKVMLAASTNAAIDNILERLDDLPLQIRRKILAVRLGNESAISESVNKYTVFNLDKDLQEEIVSRANLVCGTIIGILQHPDFNLNRKDEQAVPLYDCLIVDEASKTTFQEFLVPAIYAKKWILSGDLRQLTPYIEQDSIESSLKQIPEFNDAHQTAQTMLMTLDGIYAKKDNKEKHLRFCLPVDSSVLKAIPDLIQDYPKRTIGLIGNVSHKQAIQTEEFLSGVGRQFIVYGSDILFCDKNDFARIERFIPGSFIVLLSKDNSLSSYQTDGYFNGNLAVSTSRGSIKQPSEVRRFVNEEMKSKSWAGEIAWRLCRIQELFLLSELAETRDEQRSNYQKAIQERIPKKYQDSISNTIGLITEIALPSIIQLLQKGVSNRNIVQSPNETTLNRGFSEVHLRNRHTLVEYQHRMHSDIAAFSAKHIYEGKALNNGHIIDRSWSYTQYPCRAYWLDVPCIEKKNNENSNEVDTIVKEIRFFAEYAKMHLKKNGEPWSIACLTYYRKQEDLLKKAVQKITGCGRASSYQKPEDSTYEVMIYTVDKFQGKEADVVFLSMIKSGDANLGFMDSPNRLNVALTRAKYQMVVVGNKEYFRSNKCRSELLKALVEEYSK